jgi:hypothetical protein
MRNMLTRLTGKLALGAALRSLTPDLRLAAPGRTRPSNDSHAP